MPQLDFITYLNQYMWTIGVLSFCVVIMCATLLPNIKYGLESRSVEFVSFNYKREHEFIVFKKLLSS
uniref:ATP synthase F0 subunit 8 n=1 Tax=Chrysaora pacifica TaxID=1911418 RepID=A0A6G7GEP8_9CNID|nr:ATP synthase F0 subunit 8 [Chrysaora pacifica]QIH96588.1 ATP synthase F0 subunit 8 [Chrysaora pacifica]